jgi:hypothetical protein
MRVDPGKAIATSRQPVPNIGAHPAGNPLPTPHHLPE